MSIEVRPLGVKCNINCQYCYQNSQRDARNLPHGYDLGRIKSALENEGNDFVLFGGEPLLMNKKDLEELWAWGYKRYGRNGIQTNGTLIDENHIKMFKRYNVRVGLSIDGPGELNDVRWAGTIERTREATARTLAAIDQLCEKGLCPSIIVTLHRCNATAGTLPTLLQWLSQLEKKGVNSVRIHPLEVDDDRVRANWALAPQELLYAMSQLLKFESDVLRTLRFDIFRDMRNLLLGQDSLTACVWNACDPYTTHAVRGIEADGQNSNCGRTNKDGIDFLKADVEGFERYLALYRTPQEYGGCQGCRFFLLCKGQCPGTAIDGDWRNKTEHCSVWMALYEHMEHELLQGGGTPISLASNRAVLEQTFIEKWEAGSTTTIAQALKELASDASTAGKC